MWDYSFFPAVHYYFLYNITSLMCWRWKSNGIDFLALHELLTRKGEEEYKSGLTLHPLFVYYFVCSLSIKLFIWGHFLLPFFSGTHKTLHPPTLYTQSFSPVHKFQIFAIECFILTYLNFNSFKKYNINKRPIWGNQQKSKPYLLQSLQIYYIIFFKKRANLFWTFTEVFISIQLRNQYFCIR